ncbi:hypothetical protein RSAG8_11032, partial [Rhizoctonia solani AG-8 WAC10335]
ICELVSSWNRRMLAYLLQHASTTGGINSAFGLSAFFFSTLARELFPGRTGAFLTVLCLGTGTAVLLGAMLVRPPPVGQIRLESAEEAGETEGAEDEDRVEEEQRPFWTEQTPLRTGTFDESVLYGERNPWASQAATPNASGAATPNANGPRSNKAEVHGLSLFTSLDFLILFGIVGCLGGPGLMYINNVGSIVQALFAVGEGWSKHEAEKAQASQVGILSVCSFVGRFAVGFLADHLSHSHTIPRTSCLLLSSTIGIRTLGSELWHRIRPVPCARSGALRNRTLCTKRRPDGYSCGSLWERVQLCFRKEFR